MQYLTKNDPRRKFGAQLGGTILQSSNQQPSGTLNWRNIIIHLLKKERILLLLYVHQMLDGNTMELYIYICEEKDL